LLGGTLACVLTLAIALGAAPAALGAGQEFSSDGQTTHAGPTDNERQGQSPENFSAGDQYVEMLPTPGGPRPAGKGRARSVPLPKGVQRQVQAQGGPDAGKLTEIATSPRLGAPEHKGGKAGRGGGDVKRHGRSAPAVPSAAVGAVGSGRAGLGWLALAVLLITALALGASGYGRYRNKDSSG
jgi:hypothetical protein